MASGVTEGCPPWPGGLWVVPGLRVRRQTSPGAVGGAVPAFTTAAAADEYLSRLGRAGLAAVHVPPEGVGATLAAMRKRGESRLLIDPRQADARTVSVADALAAVRKGG